MIVNCQLVAGGAKMSQLNGWKGLLTNKIRLTKPWLTNSCYSLALDPAKPWFDLSEDQTHKISKEDAKIVDVIHTNSGPLLSVKKENLA